MLCSIEVDDGSVVHLVEDPAQIIRRRIQISVRRSIGDLSDGLLKTIEDLSKILSTILTKIVQRW